MLIHKLTSGERTVFILQNGGVQTSFTRYEANKKLGCIELYFRDLYIGIVTKAQSIKFNKALAAANARKVAA
jgi:hypothetical protein